MGKTTLPLSSSWTLRSSTQPRLGVERLTSHYVDPVYNFLYSRVGNREDAEDLTSEVFLQAAQQLDGSRAEAGIAPWLLAIARRVLADYRRRYYRYAVTVYQHDASMHEVRESPDSARSTVVHETPVHQVFESLPDRDYRVLELRFLQGYSIEETAQELGLTPENVKVIQRQALAKAVQMAEEAR